MEDLCLLTREIFPMVREENKRQITKQGIQNHEPLEWLGFATKELEKLAEAIGEWQFRKGTIKNVVKEAIQASLLCLKIAEMFNELSKMNYKKEVK